MILDCFDGCPTLQGIFTHITTEPTLLHAAEWNIGAKHCPCIHRYLTRLQGFRYPVSSVDIVGEQSCTETVMRVVGFSNDFFLGGEFSNALNLHSH